MRRQDDMVYRNLSVIFHENGMYFEGERAFFKETVTDFDEQSSVLGVNVVMGEIVAFTSFFFVKVVQKCDNLIKLGKMF